MGRRILAALGAVIAVLTVSADRLSGEPATSTTTNPLFGSDAPNPLALYPQRPGAKFDDVEAPAKDPVNVQFATLQIVSWEVVPRTEIPNRSLPAVYSRYETLGLVDGYAPRTNDTPGPLLRVTVRESTTPVAANAACVATAATDGTVLVPYDQYPLRGPSTTATTTTTTTTTNKLSPPVDVDLYFPIGERRGRVFVTCVRTSLEFPAIASGNRRAVWGIDA